MIDARISHNEHGIHIHLRLLYGKQEFTFTNNDGPGMNWDAVLAQHIMQELENKVERMRKKAYNLGWEDAKKKRKKKTIFNVCFNSHDDPAWED